MTTLQESAMRLALDALMSTDALPYEDWMRASGHPAIKALRTALAQQGEPVPQARLGMKDGLAMALSVVELYGMKGDVIYREIAKLRDGIAAAPAPQAQEPVLGTKTWFDGEKVITQNLTASDIYAEPAPQPAQEPVKFLVNGTRFKLSFDTRGRVSSLWNFMDELDGRWVALVAAEDDCHLQSAQPAQASGRTNPGDETGGAVERFGWQTFLGKSPEIVPATNGSFVWYSDYLKLWQSAQQAATKNCPQPEICGSKECEFCRDTAAPAPQPAQESRHTIPR